MAGRGGCFKRRSPLANQAALVEAASARLGALSRASCPALPRLANNTGTSRTARARRRRSCSCSGTRTTFRPAPPRARRYLSRRPGPRALAAPSPPLLLGGQKRRSNSGVSTFPVPALPVRCSSGLCPLRTAALGGRPRGQQPRGSTAPGQMFRSCESAASERRLRAPAARVSAVAAGRVLGAPQPGSDSAGSGRAARGRGAGKVRGKAEADMVRVRGQSRRLCRNMAVVERPVAWGGGGQVSRAQRRDEYAGAGLGRGRRGVGGGRL